MAVLSSLLKHVIRGQYVKRSSETETRSFYVACERNFQAVDNSVEISLNIICNMAIVYEAFKFYTNRKNGVLTHSISLESIFSVQQQYYRHKYTVLLF